MLWATIDPISQSFFFSSSRDCSCTLQLILILSTIDSYHPHSLPILLTSTLVSWLLPYFEVVSIPPVRNPDTQILTATNLKLHYSFRHKHGIQLPFVLADNCSKVAGMDDKGKKRTGLGQFQCSHTRPQSCPYFQGHYNLYGTTEWQMTHPQLTWGIK